jgi:hypothetical protein
MYINLRQENVSARNATYLLPRTIIQVANAKREKE